MHEKNIAILILAAGSSSRMGRPKQLMPWKNSTLIEHTIDLAKRLGDSVYLVLGASYNRIQSVVQNLNITTIHNKEWEKGMGGSISKGVQQIINENTVKGVLIMLVDQPLIDLQHFQQLQKVFNGGKADIVCTNYGSRKGVPAIFDVSLFSELVKFDQDFGAKQLIARNEKCISLKPIGKTTDIDTLEIYTELYQDYGKPDNEK